MSSSGRPQTLLEKWLEDMPNTNEVSVKKERKDFKDLFSSSYHTSLPSSSSTPSTAPFPPQTQPQQKPQQPPPAEVKVAEDKDIENAVDAQSIRGLFGWDVVQDIPLPCILREDERLVPVRIVESKVIGKFSSILPWTVFSCINIRSYYVTENEAKLLNEINSFHCDYHYGYEPFTTKDVVVCLPDVVILHRFLETSKDIFSYGLLKSGIDWLGFVNISGSHIVPYVGKRTTHSSSTRKFVPQSLVQHRVLLVKVEKCEMSEWDASYLRMLCIYAGLEHLNIQSNDILCLLSDLKWDSSLCPLHIEECTLSLNRLPNKLNPTTKRESSSYQQTAHRSGNQNIEDPDWMLNSNPSSANPALRTLHQISRIEINGIGLRAINLKPYSNQQAVFVSDVVTKMYRGVSVLTAHYILEKILQVKLYECTRLHEDAFIRAGVRPLQGDKLVAVETLRKCLPQLRQIILAGMNGFTSPPIHG